MRPPKAILFDLGDTIVRHEPVSLIGGLRRLFDQSWGLRPYVLEDLLPEFMDIWFDVDARRRASMVEFPFHALLRIVTEKHGLRLAWTPEEAEREFIAGAMIFRPDEEAAPALDALRNRGLRLAILSNSIFSGKFLETVVKRFGLDGYFEFLMSSADYLLRKPHPLLFLTAAARLDLSPEDLWHVGDSLEFDVTGARAAGMAAVWINRSGKERAGEVVPDFEIRSLRELAEAF